MISSASFPPCLLLRNKRTNQHYWLLHWKYFLVTNNSSHALEKQRNSWCEWVSVAGVIFAFIIMAATLFFFSYKASLLLFLFTQPLPNPHPRKKGTYKNLSQYYIRNYRETHKRRKHGKQSYRKHFLLRKRKIKLIIESPKHGRDFIFFSHC